MSTYFELTNLRLWVVSREVVVINFVPPSTKKYLRIIHILPFKKEFLTLFSPFYPVLPCSCLC